MPPTTAPSDLLTLPVLPLRDVVFFPHVVMPLVIGRKSSLASLDATVDGDVFVVAQCDPAVEEPSSRELYRVGAVARVLQLTRLPNGSAKVLLEAKQRGRVTRYTGKQGAPLRAQLRPFPLVDTEQQTPMADATARRAIALFEEYVELQRRIPSEVISLVQGAANRERQAYAIAAHVPAPLEVRQDILEARTLEDAFAALGRGALG